MSDVAHISQAGDTHEVRRISDRLKPSLQKDFTGAFGGEAECKRAAQQAISYALLKGRLQQKLPQHWDTTDGKKRGGFIGCLVHDQMTTLPLKLQGNWFAAGEYLYGIDEQVLRVADGLFELLPEHAAKRFAGHVLEYICRRANTYSATDRWMDWLFNNPANPVARCRRLDAPVSVQTAFANLAIIYARQVEGVEPQPQQKSIAVRPLEDDPPKAQFWSDVAMTLITMAREPTLNYISYATVLVSELCDTPEDVQEVADAFLDILKECSPMTVVPPEI